VNTELQATQKWAGSTFIRNVWGNQGKQSEHMLLNLVHPVTKLILITALCCVLLYHCYRKEPLTIMTVCAVSYTLASGRIVTVYRGQHLPEPRNSFANAQLRLHVRDINQNNVTYCKTRMQLTMETWLSQFWTLFNYSGWYISYNPSLEKVLG
jgi:hypothetical protein